MSEPPPIGRDEPVEPPRWTALDPEPPELDVLEPLLDPLDPLDLGGADRVGCDCGIGIEGISRVLEPAPLLVVEPELGGGASLVVGVRGMA
jgi:hypothetical protein